MMPLRDDNPYYRVPAVTLLLIATNVAVFIWQLSFGGRNLQIAYQYGAVPARLLGLGTRAPSAYVPEPLTIFTSMFLHGGFVHLFGNMLYLWIFGNNIEDSLGHFRFLIFYLVCGLIASVSYILYNPKSDLPMVGASGAIAGVLGAYLVLFPFARVHTLVIFFLFIRVVRIPAVFLLVFWFVIQLVSVGSGGGVAWAAHIGGFLAGLVLIRPFLRLKHRGRLDVYY